MTDPEKRIDPRHQQIRGALKAGGLLATAAGVVFAGVGFISFFSSFGSFEPPRYFWCAFVGLPLAAIGVTMLRWAYMGAVVRYAAGEVAPAGKDTMDYLASETSQSVQTVAEAVGKGLAAAGSPHSTVVLCHKCNAENDPQAKFCGNCGAALRKMRPCPSCSELNDPDAKFCDNCGVSLQ
jgi:ribosomal protein L40E